MRAHVYPLPGQSWFPIFWNILPCPLSAVAPRIEQGRLTTLPRLTMPRISQTLTLLVLALLPTWSTAQPPLPERATFYIAPVIEGLSKCRLTEKAGAARDAMDTASHCAQSKFDTHKALTRVLDKLEPGGPKGKVQVGYTMTIQLLSLFEKKNGHWVLNAEHVDEQLSLISQTQRPVVIYLAANHFDTQGLLSTELAKDKRNLLLLANGSPPSTKYFDYAVTPFTLLTDETIPVNRYRFEALRHVAQKIAKLPPDVKKRIIAVSLAGELHHMFPDFENGMGAFEKTEVTDYSPASVAQFKTWLADKYKTIEAFNKATGFAFANFEAIPVPGKNIRTERLSSFAEHYDGFAHGSLPVSGWIWSPKGQIDKLEFFVDGKHVANVDQSLNRLDVYRAIEEINNPNVGFRYDYTYDKLPEGRHVGQLIAQAGESRYLVAQFNFNVMSRDQHLPPRKKAREISALGKISDLEGVRSWLDLPRQEQDVYFNPVARDWNLFRTQQTHAMLAKFHSIAREAGIAPSLLFSHQILPQVNSTWNDQLFAVNSTFGAKNPWHDGINMYGGSTNSDWVRKFIKNHKITDYGVPEFNPQQWKQSGVHLNALAAQYRDGARFVSPYYISLTFPQDGSRKPATGPAAQPLNMEIEPNNQSEGSAAFHRAIQEFSAH